MYFIYIYMNSVAETANSVHLEELGSTMPNARGRICGAGSSRHRQAMPQTSLKPKKEREEWF